MFNKVSRAVQPLLPYQAAVSAIWSVDSDESYHVINLQHSNDAYIALRTLNGAGKLTTDTQEYRLEKDSILILRWREILKYWTEKSHWNFYWIEFFTQDELPANQCFQVPIQENEIYLLNHCFEILSINNSILLRKASGYFSSVLAGWLAQKNSICANVGQMEKTVNIIHAAPLQENITVEQLANDAGMSVRSFRGAFEAYTGDSPKNYILRRKLNAAMELLNTANLSVGEISDRLGFSTPYYFSRIFKEKLGLTPSQYRNMQK